MAEEEVDWRAVTDTLRRMKEEVNTSIRELCELGYHEGCTTIAEQVLPVLNRMLRYAESRIPAGYYERDTERKLRQEIFAVARSISREEAKRVGRLMAEIKECIRYEEFRDAERAYVSFMEDYFLRTGELPEYEEALCEWFFEVTGKYPPPIHLKEMFEAMGTEEESEEEL